MVTFFSRFKESKINLKESDLIDSVKNNPSKDRKILLPNKFTLADYEQSVILIHQILSSRSESSYLQMRDYLTSALLIQLFNSYISNSYINEEDSRASFIKEWIRAHISSTLTVPGIAKQLELNPDYLTRIFKKCTGMTMLQYLNHLKIEVATTLLVRTEMSVKQISSRAYFNDSKVFIRKFHQELGLSPTEYRKSYHLIHLNNPHIDPQIPIPKDIADSIDFIPENGNIKENDFLVKK
ncbi:helix-turn-helix domain-containing protein [Oenococcus oeni]|uniref:helix-turn-helix domain-containing protein n=2 Tax=Oenococcus oeni TaxID=1247 RepID=UPI0002DE7C4A|nr:AraC family transcriptional regulator [Oenococcus oeni]UCU86088.1 helix-turn-helix transcriptional regulator [Oenococcus oeni]